MQHFSTDNYLGATRVDKWSNIAEQVFTKLEIEAANPQSFQGDINSVEFGPVILAMVNASPAKITRTAASTSWSRERFYFLHLQVDGEMQVTQDGRSVVIGQGDMALCDSGLAYNLEYDVPAKTLVMIVPHNVIKRKLPAPEVTLARLLPGSSGLAAVLSRTLLQLWDNAENVEYKDDVARRLGENLIDLFSIATMDAFGDEVLASATGSARRSHIRCHIESNLKDPDMTVSSIAKSFRISTRYLHMLFAEGNETVSELIRRRRLEEIKKRLGNPSWKNRTITQLAFAWGFNNTTHFARVFRERFGVSPREYRNSILNSGSASEATPDKVETRDKKSDEADSSLVELRAAS